MPSPEFIELLSKALEGDVAANSKLDPSGEEVAFAKSIITEILSKNPNHPHALYLCGLMHEKGKGGVKDLVQAIQFYERAIACGSVIALDKRARMHHYGIGGPVNNPEAIRLLEQGIGLGDSSAMYSRGFMYELGSGCEENATSAVMLYKKAYGIDQNSYVLTRLIWMAYTNQDAREALSLIYFKEKKLGGLERLYLLNPQKLKTFLCQEIIKRLDESSLDEEYIQSIIDFVLEKTITSNDDEQLNYIRFKIALLQLDTIKAVDLYCNLDVRNCVTAQDLFHFGHIFLNGIGGLAQKDKISRIGKACEYLYQSHKKGDKNAYPVLVKLLRDKETLENNTPIFDVSLDKGVDEKQEVELVNRFIQKIKQKDNLSTISIFNSFITAKKHRRHKKNKEERASKSLQLAQDMVMGLTQGFELPDVIALPENKSRIKSRGRFFMMLESMVEKTGHNLNQLLEDTPHTLSSVEQSNMQLVIYNPNT